MAGIPVVLFKAACSAIERGGVDVAPHLQAAGIAEGELTAIHSRVDWDKAATFLDRCADAAGLSPDQQEQLGEFFVKENTYLQISARLVVSPMMLHEHVWRLLTCVYTHLEIEHRKIDARTLTARIAVPEPYVSSQLFLRGTAGSCRAATRLLGLGPSQVEMEIGPREARYWIRLPQVDAAAGRLNAAGQLLMAAFHGLVTEAMPGAAPSLPSVSRLQRQLGLTRAEARVAVRVGQGLRPHEIADELHVGLETVRTHLKRIYAKTGTRGQVELALLIRRQTSDGKLDDAYELLGLKALSR